MKLIARSESRTISEAQNPTTVFNVKCLEGIQKEMDLLHEVNGKIHVGRCKGRTGKFRFGILILKGKVREMTNSLSYTLTDLPMGVGSESELKDPI